MHFYNDNYNIDFNIKYANMLFMKLAKLSNVLNIMTYVYNINMNITIIQVYILYYTTTLSLNFKVVSNYIQRKIYVTVTVFF